MEKPERAVFTPLDFRQWDQSAALVLTPKFQRRPVWTTAAKSYFIDTILRGMPTPPIYMRRAQSKDRSRTVREVVDGQQRVSAVLSFLDGSFKLSKNLIAPWAGKTFDQLTTEEQDKVASCGFSVESFQGISDQEVLQVFARLNTHGVKLNKQELRNGRFFGRFKQTVYDLSLEHLEFWRHNSIFSERSIARMLEAEFVSEVLVAFLHGMQDKKTSLDTYYEQYEDNFPVEKRVTKQFRAVLDEVNEAFPSGLDDTAFSRAPLFYTLCCALQHHLHGLPKASQDTPRKALSSDERIALRDAVLNLSEAMATSKSGGKVSSKYVPFVASAVGQTDNIKPREHRFAALYKAAFR